MPTRKSLQQRFKTDSDVAGLQSVFELNDWSTPAWLFFQSWTVALTYSWFGTENDIVCVARMASTPFKFPFCISQTAEVSLEILNLAQLDL